MTEATLRQLEYLVTVVDELSFTRAAEKLHVTQPALSHQIRVLERAVGGMLLERLPRSVRLTPMGRAMLPHARAALVEAEHAVDAARRTAGLVEGEVQLAAPYSVGFGVLPPTLQEWRRRYGGGLRVRLVEFRHVDEMHAAMLAGKADVAVGPPPTDWTGPVHLLGDEEFVVVLPHDHPAAGGDTPRIRLAELADSGWVHYEASNGLADVLDRACAHAGFQPRVAVRTEQTVTAPTLAAAGLGPALVPANVIPPRFEGRVLRPDPPIPRTLVAYTRTGPDPLTAALIDVIGRTACLVPEHVGERLAGEPPGGSHQQLGAFQ